VAETEKKTTKRLVKNPETFREKALKATEASDKPKRSLKLKQNSGKVTQPVLGPVGRLLNKIFNRQPFILISRILLPRYFRDSWRELRLVSWPSRKQSRDLTYAVLAFAIVFGGVVALVDYGLDKVFKGILLK
jgi:preprotein translocase SecE subunit